MSKSNPDPVMLVWSMMEQVKNYRVIHYQKPWPPLESHFNEHFRLAGYQEGALPPSQETAG